MNLAGSISLERVYHHALLGNRLGDPATRTIPIYLPPGFDRGTRYPAVYYLPGFTVTSLSAITEYSYLPDFPKYALKIAAKGGVPKYLEWFKAQDYVKGDTIGTLNVLGMAAAYSPNLDADGGFDLPFDLETGELISAVWNRWLEND